MNCQVRNLNRKERKGFAKIASLEAMTNKEGAKAVTKSPKKRIELTNHYG
jgi:hypothetical protein